MAKKNKYPLERWTPPVEMFSGAKKTTGDSGVTYSYEERKKKRKGTGEAADIHALGAGGTAKKPEKATEQTPRSTGVETLLEAQKALQNNGASGGRGGRMNRESAAAFHESAAASRAAKRGKIANTISAGVTGWGGGQANALGFLADSGIHAGSSAGLSGKVHEKEIEARREKQLGGVRDKSYAAADRLNTQAAADEAEAKKGLGKVGQILVDVGIAGTQLAADATIGRLTGTGMASMGARTFGGSAREAMDSGATRQQALAYGAGSAAVEMLTEKMFDVGKIFGKGAGDELIEKAVEKWAKTPAGRSALRTFFGVLTESGEEAASDLVNPIIRQFYDSDAVKETYGTAEGRRQLAADVAHDAAVGGILGGLGTVVNGNRTANAEIRAREAAAEAARMEQSAARTQAQNERFAGNAMQTGTADAEAAELLRRNAERRGETAQEAAESPVLNRDDSEGSLTANEETAPVQRENGQIREKAQTAPRSDAEIMREAAGIRTFEDVDRQPPQSPDGDSSPRVGAETGQHIDRRTAEDYRRPSVNAFQHDHPELHEHFVNVAREMQEAAAGSLDTQTPGRKGGTNADYTPELARVMEQTGLTRPKLIAVLQDIIDNHGSENYADAKRVEKALDGLLSDGKYMDADYLRKKGEIEGGTDPNSWEYALEHEYGLSIALGEMTEAEARAEWEARKQPATEAARTESNLPEGHGAMSPAFPYQEAPSQTNSADSLFTDEERQNVEGLRPEDLTHQVRTNADVDYHAQERLESDYEGEKADLYRDDKEWDVVDIATAWQILAQETRAARESGDWGEVVRLRKIYRDKASNWGQVGHEMSRHAHTAEDIVSDAAEQLDEIGDIPPDEFNETMNQIDEFANEWENTNPEHPEGLLDLIRRLNAARRTGGLFTPGRTGNTLNRTLEAVLQQEGGFDYLRQIAEQQIRNFANDRAPLSPIEAAKSVRYMSMLSKLTTVMRNLIGNNVFDPIESVSGNVATIPDMLMSLVTHRRTTAADASWFSSAKRRGSMEAMQRAYISAALDADTTGDTNRWEQRNGRTFKMAGNPLSRFLSTIEKWQQYALTVTDEFQKGGIEAEAERQRQRLIDRGRLGENELQGWAEETARQRTFQNEGRVSNLMLGARNLLNGIGTINDGRGGSFGVGDALIPFARVPGNVVGQFLNYTPAGLARGMFNMANVLVHARSGNITAEQQAQAARDIGRGLNGSAILAGFAALAAKGVLNVADGGDSDDEKDLAKLQQSEGITGTQWNLSATQRWLSGGSADWQDGDDLMSIGFLEPINGLMALAALVAESREDGVLTGGEILSDTWESTLQAVQDLPAMSSLTNIVNNYKYSNADSAGGKALDAGAQLVGDTVSSFVPNALTGIAQGMDEGTVRQTYGSDKAGLAGVAEETLNTVKGKIPGLRSQLPAALDNFGQERKTTATSAQNWLNSNVLPGAVTKYDTNRVNQEIERLAAEGAKVPDRSAEKSFTQDGQKYELDTKQQRAYQKTYGQTVRSGVQELLRASEYLSMSRSEQAEMMDAVLDYARQTARQTVKPAYELNSAAEKANSASDELGMSPVEYLLMAAGVAKYNEDGAGNIKNDELEDALNDLYDDDDEMKSAIWTFYGRADKTNPWR